MTMSSPFYGEFLVSEQNIRHRAFALKDALHAIIREDLDEEFETECQEVRRRRMEKGDVLCTLISVTVQFYFQRSLHVF